MTDEPLRDAVCINCGYRLTKLPENRCPECGTEFDPEDHDSFRTPDSPELSGRLVVLIAAGNLGCFGILLVMEGLLNVPLRGHIEMGYRIVMSPLALLAYWFPLGCGGVVLVVLFNSVLWGYAIAYLVLVVQRSQRRRE